MSIPVEMMFDGVEWTAVEPPSLEVQAEDGLPYPTHEGELEIMGVKLDVLTLSNGQRIITEESMCRLFGSMAE